MGLISKLLGGKKEDPIWTANKSSDTVYPKSSISILTLKTKRGGTGTGWVNKAYEQYAYKKFCPYNVLIKVDLKDSIAQKNPDLDMRSVEEFFSENLRRICIAHMVARLVTDEGMNIEMYVEKGKQVAELLHEIAINKNRLVSFTTEINKDPNWMAVSGLMKL
ncbi:hypothetical protein QWZ08_15515 [Ferruginibacter paludis]|nr:hypothetical protein [Ferruginibacter paludis]